MEKFYADNLTIDNYIKQRQAINQKILNDIGIQIKINSKIYFELSNHLILKLESLIKNAETEEIEIFITKINNYLNKIQLNSSIYIVDKSSCEILDTESYLDNIFLISDFKKVIGVDESEFSEYLKFLSDIGYSHIIRYGLSVLITLEKNRSPSRSYTIRPLINTIFIDTDSNPLLTMENIIHEAGHNYLNILLESSDVVLGDTMYYSPWKNCRRPEHGFLHAVWSFSIVTNYYKKVHKHYKDDKEMIDFRISYEQNRLKSIERDLVEVLDKINDKNIRNNILEEYREAIKGGEKNGL